MLHIFCSTRLLHYFLQEVGPPTKRMVLMFSFTFWPPHTEVRALPFPAVPSFWMALSWLCLLIHSHGLVTPSFLGPFVLRASGLYTIFKNPLLNSLSSLRVLSLSFRILFNSLQGPSWALISPDPSTFSHLSLVGLSKDPEIYQALCCFQSLPEDPLLQILFLFFCLAESMSQQRCPFLSEAFVDLPLKSDTQSFSARHPPLFFHCTHINSWLCK